jgi:hypothetical protein
MRYLRRKDTFPAVQWTGSNKAEVEELVALLPQFDPHYAEFINISVSSSGSILTIAWDSSKYGNGSLQFETGWWVVATITSGGHPSLPPVQPIPEDSLFGFNVVEPQA